MEIQIKPKEATTLLPTDILFQTVFWGQVKSRLGWKTLAFDFSCSDPRSDILILTKTFGHGFTAAYVPQGPEFVPAPDDYGVFLEALSEALTSYLDPEVAFIRYDLPWESPYIAGSNDDVPDSGWPGHPEARVRELRMNFGTKSWNLRKAVTDLTVADVLILNINRSENEILSAMKPKTRYNIRLAQRKGVIVVLAGVDRLPAFYDLYCQTARRNNFPRCEYEHFSALFSALADNLDSSEILFLLAMHGKDLLAGAIVAISGRKATYLFGASSTEGRNLMGSYAVQWAAIQHARMKGCKAYDMGAVTPAMNPDHPFYGMYRFKTGFGGKIIHLNGSWDYPLREEEYRVFRNAETLNRT